MPADANDCPTEDILRAFGSGQLADAAAETIDRHLSGCPRCLALAKSGSPSRMNSPGAVPGNGTISQNSSSPLMSNVESIAPELAGLVDYHVTRKLGEGGMGAVYLARNTHVNRDYVLKVIHPHSLALPGIRKRFLREIRAAAALGYHQNIVTAYPPVSAGEVLAHVMEFVDGLDLSKLVKQQGPLPIAHACYYVGQAARGLQHAYEKGMIHRDIKPSNLMVAREGGKRVVKVADFGLVKFAEVDHGDDLTGSGAVMGTPDYIAPEQACDAAKADTRADVYSLGCTLYFLLTGKVPFPDGSAMEKMFRHLQDPFPDIRVTRPEVPCELAAVLAKMVTKLPEDRYQTPGEIMKALAPFTRPATKIEAVPVLAPAAPPPAPVGSERGGGRRAIWLVLAVVAVLAGVSAIYFAGMFRVKTPNGHIVIHNAPDGAAKSVDGVAAGIPPAVGVGAPAPVVALTTSIRAGQERSFEFAPGARMQFCWIPPGTAQLGAPESEIQAAGKLTGKEHNSQKEENRGTVSTKGFWLGKYEVMQKEWAMVYGRMNPSNFIPTQSEISKTGIKTTARFPVEDVSWEMAVEFCETVSILTGRTSRYKKSPAGTWEIVAGPTNGFRLPHEDEWEYACRGGLGNHRAFHFGSELNGFQANCDGSGPFGTESKGPNLQRTTEVGTYGSPHPWGLCDMHGNVWEWAENNYALDSNFHVLRGGCWSTPAVYCRSAHRFNRAPDHKYFTTGFRLLLPPE